MMDDLIYQTCWCCGTEATLHRTLTEDCIWCELDKRPTSETLRKLSKEARVFDLEGAYEMGRRAFERGVLVAAQDIYFYAGVRGLTTMDWARTADLARSFNRGQRQARHERYLEIQ